MRSLFAFAALFSLSVLGSFATADEAATAQMKNGASTVDVFGAGELKVPESFRRIEPQSPIIEHEFQITQGEGGDAPTARVTMMAAGGDIKANIDRWKGQFAGGNKEANKTETMKVGSWEVHLVDLNGSFGEMMGGGPFSGGKVVQRKGYAMIAAILVDPNGRKFFVKMIGPEDLVTANRESFVKMIKSIE